MKSLKLLLTVFLTVSTVFLCSAQTEVEDNPTRKGRFIADIDLAFEFGTFDQTNAFFSDDISTDRTEIATEIDFGYTIMDNLVIGLGIEIDNEKLETAVPASADGSFPASTAENTRNGLALLATAKYFFTSGQTKPFLGAGAGLLSSSTTSTSSGFGTDSSGSGFAFNAKAGVAHFINDHVGFEILYQFNSHSISVDNTLVPSNTAYETDESASNSRIFFGVLVAF